MNITALKAYGYKAIEPIAPKINEVLEKPEGGTAPKSFGEMFTRAIGEAQTAQDEADVKVESMMLGDGKVTTHDAMIALEKADISFQLLTQVRSKIVRAYEDIMRTQV